MKNIVEFILLGLVLSYYLYMKFKPKLEHRSQRMYSERNQFGFLLFILLAIAFWYVVDMLNK